MEESQKTIQLKGEIDSLVEKNGMTSSEESSSHDINNWELSPTTKEKLKIEKKYRKKITKVVETFIGRVESHSSSGSCSGDDKNSKNSKKRNYHEFLNGLKNQYNGASNNGYRVPLTTHKRR
jgi:hypothetical protein